jgi:drug/metabolite transporter (DMT)-like permease
MRKEKYIGASAIIFAAILWGFDGVILTPRLFNLNVGFVVFMLHFIPFILMNFVLFKEYRHFKNFTVQDIIIFFLIAFFGGALGTLSIVKALFLVHFQHLSIVVLLQKLQPIFAIILSAILLKEKIERNFYFWAGIAIVSSYFLTFGFNLPNFNNDSNLIKAAIWALIAAFSFGSATVFGKKALIKFTFYTTNFYRFGLTSLLMFVYVLITNKLSEFYNITPLNWILFFLISFTTGAGAIFLYYFGLKKVKAIISTICELFFPISAVFFDYVINHKSLNFVRTISALIMILAIMQISYKKQKTN